MRILFVANGFLPQIGGTEVFNAQIARELVERGHQIQLVTWSQALAGTPDSWPFPVIRLDRGSDKTNYDARRLPEIIGQFKPDVALLSRTTRRLSNLPSIFKKAKVPYVGYCHFIRNKHASRDPIRKFLARRRFGFNGAKLVIAISEFLSGQLTRMGVPASKIRVIRPGVDPERFAPNAELRTKMRRELGIEDKDVILTVARVIDGKGQERVIRTLPQLLQKYPKLYYLVVGGGSNLENLKNLTRELKLEPYVRFIGPVAEPSPYFVAADIFALPSNLNGKWMDACPLTLMEAGASQLPSIASQSGGSQEIIVTDETGFLISENDSEALGSAIAKLIEHPELRERMGSRARQRVLSRMVWAKSAQSIEQVLEEAAQLNLSGARLGLA